MENKPIKTFSENIRNMFTKYAILPVFIITIACIVLFFSIWQYMVYKSNFNANEEISRQVKETINDYAISLNSLSKNTDLFKDEISVDQLVEIRRDMYSLNQKTGYPSDLYIYDINLNSILPNGNSQTDFKLGQSKFNWGIFREINDNPQNISIKLTSSENRILCIGRGVLDQGDLLGYVLVTIDMEEFQKLISTVAPQIMIADNHGWIYLSNNYMFQDEFGRLG